MQEPFLDQFRFKEDFAFDNLYPRRIKDLSEMHWTPLNIAQMASEYLAEPNSSVLDIGSGVGKFCITAGFHNPQTTFYGIEQRKDLISYAEQVKKMISLKNVEFIHGNLTELDFNNYNHFYFFNAFNENLHPENSIDKKVGTSAKLYHQYADFLFEKLDQTPSGTKLVTYHGKKNRFPLVTR